MEGTGRSRAQTFLPALLCLAVVLTALGAPRATATQAAVPLAAPGSCTEAAPCSIFPDSPTGVVESKDGPAIEAGTRFRSAEDGQVVAIRLFKPNGKRRTYTPRLYSNEGTLLGSAPATTVSGAGWQTLTLATPVAITAGTTYLATYYSASGWYPTTDGGLRTAVANAPLTALADGTDGPNGVYRYGSGGGFPTETWNASNYWADVLFQSAADPAPTVVSTTPSDGASGVPVGTDVQVVFSEPVDPATVGSITLVAQGVPVPAAVSLSGDGRTATLDPDADLVGERLHTLNVGTGVTDLTGNPLAAPVTTSFTTVETTPPTVVSTTPADGASGVAVDADQQVVFSEPVDPATVGSITLSAGVIVPAVVSLSADGRTATIDPAVDLAEQTVHVLTVGTGVTDVAGNPLAAPVTVTFTTADVTAPEPATGLTATAGDGQVLLTWTPSVSSDVVSYRVYRAQSSPVPTVLGSLVGSSSTTTFTDSAVTGGITYFYTVVAVDSSANASGPSTEASSTPTAAGPNAIVAENSLPGSPESQWDVNGAGDASIQGFATDISVNRGQTVRFKIDTPSSDYRVDIYRLGYYGGDGARRVATVQPSAALPQNQPNCLEIDGTTRDNLIDCGNWAVSASWPVPADAVSGVYLARPVREDVSGDRASHIIFVVRDDDAGSDLLFQTSDSTWQAYNQYGGYSLYDGPSGHAHKVSYNRPITTRATSPEDNLFNAEYPMIRWLERNGYDVSYTTNVDSDRRGAELLEHDVFLSVGHDEYWSAGQRANVEAARDAGVHLAFLSGNEVYWKTRWEPSSASGSSVEHRTLVAYKEGSAQGGEHYDCLNDYDCDPHPTEWTGLWRENQTGHDGGRPENALSGQISWGNATAALQVPSADASLRFWRSTGMSGSTTLDYGLIGYEFDWEQAAYASSYPAGRITVSATTVGGLSHRLSLYRAASGAIVFGAGTVQWSWGLDPNHDRAPSNASADPRVQQATVNLLADMGVQPASLQGSLTAATASTDATAPTTTITTPAQGDPVSSGDSVTVTGTASDASPGRVAGVEVSVDGGATWQPATGRASWTFTFTAEGSSDITITSRAIDDSLNAETPGPGVRLTMGGIRTCTASTPCSIFADSAAAGVGESNDGEPLEVGTRFRSEQAGQITAIRIYKPTSTTRSYTGRLYSSTGTLLGATAATSVSGSGWQSVPLTDPVSISANTTYVVSYYSASGWYAVTDFGLRTAVGSAPLTALADGADGPNGVYRYGSGFPTSSYNSSNYWADVVFRA